MSGCTADPRRRVVRGPAAGVCPLRVPQQLASSWPVPSRYPSWFYAEQEAGSLASARLVVPLVLDLVGPTSVLDVGCGLGTWLSVFRDLGVEDVTGIDGDHVDTSRLRIPPSDFRAADLTSFSLPPRRFDLTVCLEVAEHLSEGYAPRFVQSLADSSDLILFSAAIPGQGGTHHVNEQWPVYWARIFGASDFVAVDCLRPALWEMRAVEYWYAQNIMFFVKRQALNLYPKLAEFGPCERPMSLVHPRAYSRLLLHRSFSALSAVELAYRWSRRAALGIASLRRDP